MADQKLQVDPLTAAAALMRGAKAERRWDEVLGGERSRPYRDIAAWAVLRLVAGGAALEDVLAYVRGAAELG